MEVKKAESDIQRYTLSEGFALTKLPEIPGGCQSKKASKINSSLLNIS